MGIRLIRFAAVFLALAAFSPLIRAQTDLSSEKIKNVSPAQAHNLEGVWNGRLGTVGGTNINKDTAPMLPWAQAKFDYNTVELKKGGSLTRDPTFHCDPTGVPRVYSTGLDPFEIVQTPNRIFLFYESNHIWRTVWMDGRKIPKDPEEPLWMGYSVGRWEGDDLVIETAGFNDKTWIDAAGSPHSEALHVAERFRRVDQENLQLEVTIEDPKAYTHSWKMMGAFKLKPTWEIGEAYCVAGDQKEFEKSIMNPTRKP